jgi:hypothetical protein
VDVLLQEDEPDSAVVASSRAGLTTRQSLGHAAVFLLIARTTISM